MPRQLIAKCAGPATLVLLTAATLAAQPATFGEVSVRFPKAAKRELDEKRASLTLNDTARRLLVTSSDRPLDVGYDEVTKVIVEVDTMGERASFGATFAGMFAGGLLFGGAITNSIDKPFDGDHFVYIEHAKAGAPPAPYVLRVSRPSVPRVLQALKASFGERVVVPVFDEKPETIDKKTLKSGKTRWRQVSTSKQHPLPEPQEGKALLVVVCPATIMRRSPEEKPGAWASLHANDVVVGANGPGTYSFFHLDPGEYLLISQTHDAVGLRMTLEAGGEYYLTQTVYAKGMRPRSFLTRHSKELVMFEVSGSMWSDWALDDGKKD